MSQEKISDIIKKYVENDEIGENESELFKDKLIKILENPANSSDMYNNIYEELLKKNSINDIVDIIDTKELGDYQKKILFLELLKYRLEKQGIKNYNLTEEVIKLLGISNDDAKEFTLEENKKVYFTKKVKEGRPNFLGGEVEEEWVRFERNEKFFNIDKYSEKFNEELERLIKEYKEDIEKKSQKLKRANKELLIKELINSIKNNKDFKEKIPKDRLYDTYVRFMNNRFSNENITNDDFDLEGQIVDGKVLHVGTIKHTLKNIFGKEIKRLYEKFLYVGEKEPYTLIPKFEYRGEYKTFGYQKPDTSEMKFVGINEKGSLEYLNSIINFPEKELNSNFFHRKSSEIIYEVKSEQ